MAFKQEIDLSEFDDQLIDGLVFCGMVYDLFDQLIATQAGLEQLRLRSTKFAKRLVEELVPIARYIQDRYRPGYRSKVRWLSGSQSYDAVLWYSGDGVRRGGWPRKRVLEVTTAVHRNNHLAREQLHKEGMSWGAKSIARDKKTKQILSKPHVFSGDERATDLADQVIERLKTKSAKRCYPPSTVLIVQCFAEGLLLEDEWARAVELVDKAQQHTSFAEVFLYEPVRSNSATLYGNRRRGRRSTPK